MNISSIKHRQEKLKERKQMQLGWKIAQSILAIGLYNITVRTAKK